MKSKRTVLITGGAKGIGKAMTETFAEEGYNVLTNFNKSEARALDLLKCLKEKGLNVEKYRADVTDRSQVKEMINYCVSKFGRIDILINNAGIAQEKLFTDITDGDWDDMINTNLKSVFYCSQEVLKEMISEKSGKIINISSIWGLVGASCESHYSMSKAGVIGLTKSLAKELGPSNIQVNCIAPGVIETDMLCDCTEDDLNVLRESTPLMRLGSAKDIANCALFLASDHSDFITGQVISPNGGFVI